MMRAAEVAAFAKRIEGLGYAALWFPEAAARASLAIYLELPNYRRNLKRFGLTDDDFANGGSNKLVDTTVAWVDEKAIDKRIRAHIDAGADHVCIQPLNPDGTPTPDWNVLEAFAPAKNA